MNTAQIILLAVLLVLSIFCYIKVGIGNSKGINVFNYIVLWLLLTLITISVIFVQIIVVNDLNEKVKGKCPEYKKVENVYQRVQ